MAQIQFDDTYTGPRWTYGSQLRPFTSLFGYQDFIIGLDRRHPEFPTFGTMQTTEPVSMSKAQGWDLILVNHTQGETINVL